jgi:two-component system invasion response regulator UvrY
MTVKVMVVDDHNLVRDGIRSILEAAEGVDVIALACNGTEALELMETRSQPDVVLMDINMPELGGLETTKRIVKKYPRIKVIVLTVHDEAPFPAQLFRAGAVGYLTKGCPADEMIMAINRVAAGGTYLASEIAQRQALASVFGQKDDGSSPFKDFSERETQIAMMILQGMKNYQIAEELLISPKTVSTYRKRVYVKTGAANEATFSMIAHQFGFGDKPEPK